MTAMPSDPPLLAAALAWHDAGVCVLPAAADGTKRPALPWAQYQRERPDVVDLTAWLGGTPSYQGIGIVCGAVSGNLEMFELEAAAVRDGLDLALREQFEMLGHAELWAKLQTYVEMTPSGGVHWIFRVAGAPVRGNTKLARRRVDGEIKVLMETRGEGGWTIAAPSTGRTHPTGKSWRIVFGTPGVIPVLTADEYATLHRLAATFDEMPTIAPPVEIGRRGHEVTRRPGEQTPGDAYNEQTAWGDLLIPAGWRKVGQRGDVTFWRRPGKNVGISATTGYMGDWLYVFSTSTQFEAERTYTRFGAYAVLHHGGDFQTATSALRRAGYGSPLEKTSSLTLLQGGNNVTDETLTVQVTEYPAFEAPIAASNAQAEPPEDPPTWGSVDLSSILDGTFVPQVPELLRRTDGFHLLYRGRVHSFHGESESGKSWVALFAAAERLLAGDVVAMVDFESDAHTTVGRLLRLGVPAAVIGERFSYRRPERNPRSLAHEFEAWTELLGTRYTVVILDGVTEAFAVFGITSKDNDEVTGWIRAVPRQIAASTGAAVILVDHVTKDADSRGRFAIGGQAKMAALDGAAYVVEVLEPLGVGLVGKVSLRVAKDRPGGVRPHSGMWRKSDRTQESAVVVIDSSVADITTITVEMPRTDTADTDEADRRPFRPTGLMERVSRALELANAAMSRNAIASAVHGRREFVMQAIDCLLDDGYLAADGPSLNGGRPTLRLVRPYREAGGPVPDLDPTDLVPETPSGRPVPVPGLTTGERRNGSRSPTDTRSRNGSGTGRERVGLDSLDTYGQSPSTESDESEDSFVQVEIDERFSTGNGWERVDSEGDDL